MRALNKEEPLFALQLVSKPRFAKVLFKISTAVLHSNTGTDQKTAPLPKKKKGGGKRALTTPQLAGGIE
jgi:hypothetical protein